MASNTPQEATSASAPTVSEEYPAGNQHDHPEDRPEAEEGDEQSRMPKKKTLLLVFIHGFQGTDDTFARFPYHICDMLNASIAASLPEKSESHDSFTVEPLVYPAFETRGDLLVAVRTFRDWLLNAVIDREVGNQAPSPFTHPSVRVILVGHSMGGIVAAEAALGIVQDSLEEVTGHETPEEGADEALRDLPSNTTTTHNHGRPKDGPIKAMFPLIQGIMAFDTPYLGISPGVVAHGAEEHWSASKKWYDAAAGMFSLGASAATSVKDKAATSTAAGSTTASKPAEPTQQTPAWQRWTRTALMAGAATTAIASAGAAAWLGGGFSWVTGRLEFVSCLARKEELKRRVAAVMGLQAEYGVGWANLYTVLDERQKGAGGNSTGQSAASSTSLGDLSRRFVGDRRTFCLLPGRWVVSGAPVRDSWHEAVNDKQAGEVDCHMYMFAPDTNSGYDAMAYKALQLVEGWLPRGWPDD